MLTFYGGHFASIQYSTISVHDWTGNMQNGRRKMLTFVKIDIFHGKKKKDFQKFPKNM